MCLICNKNIPVGSVLSLEYQKIVLVCSICRKDSVKLFRYGSELVQYDGLKFINGGLQHVFGLDDTMTKTCNGCGTELRDIFIECSNVSPSTGFGGVSIRDLQSSSINIGSIQSNILIRK